MKICVFLGVWLIGFLVSLFLVMLIARLLGEDPESVYELDEANIVLFLSMILFWPFFLVFEILYFLYRFLKKWYVFAIESIIAAKEIKRKKYEEEENG